MTERLSTKNLLSFSLSGIGRDMAYGLFSNFLMTFVLFTRTLTEPQYAAITLIVVFARIFDAFNDPIMGAIVDNTRTRIGKFKPWILSGALSCSAVIFTIFISRADGWSFVGVMAVIYFLFSITFTMNDISYWGMLPSLTSDPNDRNRLTSFATLCASVGGGIVGIAVPTFTAGALTIGGSAASAYAIVAIVAVFMFSFCQIMNVVMVKEKPLPPLSEKARFSFKKLWNVIVKNDQLLWVVLIFVLYNVGNGVVGGGLSMTYIYFEFNYNGFLLTVFGALGAAINICVMLAYPLISKKFTRKQLMRLSITSIVSGYLMLFLFGSLLPTSLGYVKFAVLSFANAFVGAGQGLFYIVLMIMIANTVEYNDYKHGEREEGIIYSLRPFTAKLGSALMQLAIMLVYLTVGVLTFTNEIAKLEKAASLGKIADAKKLADIGEITSSVPQANKIALLAFMCAIPILLIGTGYLVYRKKYIIDEKFYENMLKEIEARKNPQEEAQNA